MWRHYEDLEKIVDDGNTGSRDWVPLKGTAASGLLLFVLVHVVMTACLQTSAYIPPASVRFMILVLMLVSAGMFWTSRYVAARGGAWCGGKHGKRAAFYRAWLLGASVAGLILTLHARDVPTLVLGGRDHWFYSALFVSSFAAGILFPFVALAIPALGRSLRAGGLAAIRDEGLPNWGSNTKVALLVAGAGAHSDWAVCSSSTGSARKNLICALGPAACIAAVAVLARKNYYLHAHHWAMGLVFLPICASRSDILTVVATGFCLATFVEGAARWTCAPLFHRIVQESMPRSISPPPSVDT